MYSIVMLTAMSAGADVTPPATPPAIVIGAPVSHGCCGGIVTMGCTGCSGYSSCHGCCGGFLGLRSGGGLFHRSSCHGCTGSCFGSCHGSCFGSCYGSCSGYSCFGSCSGCSGSSWGPPVMMAPYTLHGYNTGVWHAGPHAVYGKVTNPNLPPVMIIPVEPKPKGSSDTMPMSANLLFKVPANAKVFVDGKKDAEPGSGTTRAFYTPKLARGKKFFYEVEVKVTVDKKEMTEKQTVVFAAGETKTVEFSKLIAAVAKPEAVAGK